MSNAPAHVHEFSSIYDYYNSLSTERLLERYERWCRNHALNKMFPERGLVNLPISPEVEQILKERGAIK